MNILDPEKAMPYYIDATGETIFAAEKELNSVVDKFNQKLERNRYICATELLEELYATFGLYSPDVPKVFKLLDLKNGKIIIKNPSLEWYLIENAPYTVLNSGMIEINHLLTMTI